MRARRRPGVALCRLTAGLLALAGMACSLGAAADVLVSNDSGVGGNTGSVTLATTSDAAQAFTTGAYPESATLYMAPVTVTTPGAPQGLTATESDTEVVLGWSPPSTTDGTAITSYQYRHAAGASVPTTMTWTPILNSGPGEANAASYMVTGLTNGTEYAFEVRAVNSAGGGTPASSDTTAPTVTSIERQDPTTSPTNADTLTWRVTFSEDVINVGGADFELYGTTAPLAATAVMVSPSIYDVTASGGNLPGLDGEVTLAVAGTNDIKDNADNDLSTAPPPNPNETYVLDNTAPTVEKIERQTPADSPTNADTLTWRVTFSEDVINVGRADFEVDGPTGATLAATAVMDSTSVYEVTASGGDLADLEDTVTLTVARTNDIKDNVDNDLSTAPPPNPNENYVLDNTAPTVSKIERQTPADLRTNADTLTWRVTFSEDVIKVGGADFEVDGPTGATLAASEVSALVYDVTASGGDLASLDDTVTLTVAGTNDIKDNANNDLSTAAAPDPNETYVLDNTAPTVTITDVPMDSTGAFPATFTFNEAVNGFMLDDITVGNATASNLTGADGDTEYTAQITPTDAGTVTVDVEADVATDLAGNGNTAATRVSSNYMAPATDSTAPTVTKIERQTPTTSPTNADFLTWRVTFSEDVINVGEADFEVDGPTGAALYVVAMTGSTSVYEVTASGGDLPSLDGEVTLSIAGTNDIKDNADNDLSTAMPPSPNETYVLDNTAPRVEKIERQSPADWETNADSLTWRVTFSENVKNVDTADFRVVPTPHEGVAPAVTAVTAVTGSTSVYDVTASGGDLAGSVLTVYLSMNSGIYSYQAFTAHAIKDDADNDLNAAPTPNPNERYRRDQTAPTVTITRLPTTTMGAFPATFTFKETVNGVTVDPYTENEPVKGFTIDDITVGNGMASALTGADGESVYMAQITPWATGPVTVDVKADVATDLAGNGNTAATRVSTYMVPATAPTADALVSTLGQPGGPGGTTKRAQPFRTGTNTNGYGLTSVEIHNGEFWSYGGIWVRIALADADGQPYLEDLASRTITLTNPSTVIPYAINTYSAPPDTVLAANKPYAIVISTSRGDLLGSDISITNSRSVDSGAAEGWSIGDRDFHSALLR